MVTIRRALLLACVPAVIVLLAGVAFAHGGNFRAPGNPGQGNPGAPPTPRAAPPVPVFTPPTPVPTPCGRLPKTSIWRPGDWQVWWQLNLEAHLPVPGSQESLGVTTPSDGLFRVGRTTTSEATPMWDRRAEHGASSLALPFLLDLLDRRRRTPEALVATALIAVGRIAREKAPIELIQCWALDTKASLEVRESAILGLGLLRRTEPARQFPAVELGAIRRFLIEFFDDEDQPMRLRAFAILSLAFLADQPYPDAAIERDGRLVTRALWRRLRGKYASRDLTIALFTALGHQPARGVPSGVREGLEAIARGRSLWRRKWDAMERSHALAAFARLGGPGCVDALLRTLQSTREHDAVQSAALIGIALNAPALTAQERVETVRTLRGLLTSDRHWLVRGLGHLAMGEFLGADLRAGSHEVLRQTDVLRFLEREAREGSTSTRPFSPVALGLAAHRVGRSSRPIASALDDIRKTLAWGLKRARGSDEIIGAYAVGAGLAKAQNACPLLLDILEDGNRMPCLRGHCALALGQLGRSTEDVVTSLRAATRERVSPFVHLQAVRALVLLDAEGICGELLSQLRGKSPSRPALAAVAVALGRIRAPGAASTLLDLARNEKASLYVRVAAVMALGLTFEPESRPSRVLLTTHANYPSLTWSLAQVFNIV